MRTRPGRGEAELGEGGPAPAVFGICACAGRLGEDGKRACAVRGAKAAEAAEAGYSGQVREDSA